MPTKLLCYNILVTTTVEQQPKVLLLDNKYVDFSFFIEYIYLC